MLGVWFGGRAVRWGMALWLQGPIFIIVRAGAGLLVRSTIRGATMGAASWWAWRVRFCGLPSSCARLLAWMS